MDNDGQISLHTDCIFCNDLFSEVYKYYMPGNILLEG